MVFPNCIEEDIYYIHLFTYLLLLIYSFIYIILQSFIYDILIAILIPIILFIIYDDYFSYTYCCRYFYPHKIRLNQPSLNITK